MIADFKIFMGVIILALMGFAFSPITGFMLIMAVAALYFMSYKMNIPEGLDSKLKSNEVLNLHFTRSKKIRIRMMKEEKGYVRLPKSKEKLFETGEWYKITPNTTYTLRGKPTVMTAEGIGHTIRIESLFVAKMIAALKLKDKTELAKFLDIPPEMLTGEKQEEKKEEKNVTS